MATSIVAERSEASILITLGSNIEPAANLERAVARLEGQAGVAVEAVSGVWESEPYGAPGTPRFLNAAVRVRCSLPLASLRRLLRRIEADLGRVRNADRNAPRTIDLDIALAGDQVIDDPRTGLRIPDPEIRLRGYLALPLAEIAGGARHPESGELLTEIATRLADDPDAPRRVAAAPGSGRVAGS